MKFFDADWVHGELDDAEVQARRVGYAAHLESIRAALPAALVELSASGLLHDALFEFARLDRPAAQLTLGVVGGDQAVGYCGLTLVYHDVVLLGDTRERLARAVAAPDAEWLTDELHLGRERPFEHRSFVWPDLELAVAFSRFALTREARDGRARRAGTPALIGFRDAPA